MRNLTLIVAALAVVVILTGCGHNAIQYGDGVGFDVGINPENCMLSMNLRYGKILSAVTRDNVEHTGCIDPYEDFHFISGDFAGSFHIFFFEVSIETAPFSHGTEQKHPG